MKPAEDSQTKPSAESSDDRPEVEQTTIQFPFAGWIPTVNGRLSFRHVGDTRHPTDSIYANLALNDRRIIVAYQRRPLSDVLFPRLIHWWNNFSDDFWFLITASTDKRPAQSDCIQGSVTIYKTREDWREKANSQIRGCIRELNVLRFSDSSNKHSLALLAFERAQSIAAQSGDIQVQFQIDRDGEIRLAAPVFKEVALERASTSFARGNGLDIRKWIADQTYFFLRDACHAHQHHEPHSDTILVLQERDPDDVEWRKYVVYSLHYAIIRFKRSNDPQAMQRAIGILAYCASFKENCRAKIKEKIRDLPVFNEEALAQSLKAKADEIVAREQSLANYYSRCFARASTARSLILAFSAVVVATLAILIPPRISSSEKDTFPNLYLASTFAADYFFSVVGILFLISVVVWVLTHSNWVVSTRSGRALLEAANVRRRLAVGVLVAVSAVVAAAFSMIFRSALHDALETIRRIRPGVGCLHSRLQDCMREVPSAMGRTGCSPAIRATQQG